MGCCLLLAVDDMSQGIVVVVVAIGDFVATIAAVVAVGEMNLEIFPSFLLVAFVHLFELQLAADWAFALDLIGERHWRWVVEA